MNNFLQNTPLETQLLLEWNTLHFDYGFSVVHKSLVGIKSALFQVRENIIWIPGPVY